MESKPFLPPGCADGIVEAPASPVLQLRQEEEMQKLGQFVAMQAEGIQALISNGLLMFKPVAPVLPLCSAWGPPLPFIEVQEFVGSSGKYFLYYKELDGGPASHKFPTLDLLLQLNGRLCPGDIVKISVPCPMVGNMISDLIYYGMFQVVDPPSDLYFHGLCIFDEEASVETDWRRVAYMVVGKPNRQPNEDLSLRLLPLHTIVGRLADRKGATQAHIDAAEKQIRRGVLAALSKDTASMCEAWVPEDEYQDPQSGVGEGAEEARIMEEDEGVEDEEDEEPEGGGVEADEQRDEAQVDQGRRGVKGEEEEQLPAAETTRASGAGKRRRDPICETSTAPEPWQLESVRSPWLTNFGNTVTDCVHRAAGYTKELLDCAETSGPSRPGQPKSSMLHPIGPKFWGDSLQTVAKEHGCMNAHQLGHLKLKHGDMGGGMGRGIFLTHALGFEGEVVERSNNCIEVLEKMQAVFPKTFKGGMVYKEDGSKGPRRVPWDLVEGGPRIHHLDWVEQAFEGTLGGYDLFTIMCAVEDKSLLCALLPLCFIQEFGAKGILVFIELIMASQHDVLEKWGCLGSNEANILDHPDAKKGKWKKVVYTVKKCKKMVTGFRFGAEEQRRLIAHVLSNRDEVELPADLNVEKLRARLTQLGGESPRQPAEVAIQKKLRDIMRKAKDTPLTQEENDTVKADMTKRKGTGGGGDIHLKTWYLIARKTVEALRRFNDEHRWDLSPMDQEILSRIRDSKKKARPAPTAAASSSSSSSVSSSSSTRPPNLVDIDMVKRDPAIMQQLEEEFKMKYEKLLKPEQGVKQSRHMKRKASADGDGEVGRGAHPKAKKERTTPQPPQEGGRQKERSVTPAMELTRPAAPTSGRGGRKPVPPGRTAGAKASGCNIAPPEGLRVTRAVAASHGIDIPSSPETQPAASRLQGQSRKPPQSVASRPRGRPTKRARVEQIINYQAEEKKPQGNHQEG